VPADVETVEVDDIEVEETIAAAAGVLGVSQHAQPRPRHSPKQQRPNTLQDNCNLDLGSDSETSQPH